MMCSQDARQLPVRTVLQVDPHIVQELLEGGLRHKEVVDGEHASGGIVLPRFPPLRLPQLRRVHKLRAQLGACSAASWASTCEIQQQI